MCESRICNASQKDIIIRVVHNNVCLSCMACGFMDHWKDLPDVRGAILIPWLHTIPENTYSPRTESFVLPAKDSVRDE